MATDTTRTSVTGRIQSRFVERSLVDRVAQLRQDLNRNARWAFFLGGIAISSGVGLLTSPAHPLPLILLLAIPLTAAAVLVLVSPQERRRLREAQAQLELSASFLTVDTVVGDFPAPVREAGSPVPRASESPHLEAPETTT